MGNTFRLIGIEITINQLFSNTLLFSLYKECKTKPNKFQKK